jgi:large-conductance mechanosensitive channel
MKSNTSQRFLQYMYSNFTGNFVGFAIGMASTRLVSHFFTTRSIKNLWGLTTSKTVVDKQTFSGMEWAVSIIIGFVVFEIISKWIKKKLDPVLRKYKGYLPEDWVDETAPTTAAAVQPIAAAIKHDDKIITTGGDSAA